MTMKRRTVFLIVLVAISVMYTAAFASDRTFEAKPFAVQVYFNGKHKALDSSYFLFNHAGYTYAPIRYIVESMGGVLSYDQEEGRIEVDYVAPSEVRSSGNSYASNSDFTLKINTEKAAYKHGEMMRIWSTFTYHGEDDVTIEHRVPFLKFYIKDRHGNYYEDPQFTMNQTDQLSHGDEFLLNFNYAAIRNFDWQHRASDEDGADSADAILAPGTYKIGVIANYSIDDVAAGLTTEIEIHVDE